MELFIEILSRKICWYMREFIKLQISVSLDKLTTLIKGCWLHQLEPLYICLLRFLDMKSILLRAVKLIVLFSRYLVYCCNLLWNAFWKNSMACSFIVWACKKHRKITCAILRFRNFLKLQEFYPKRIVIEWGGQNFMVWNILASFVWRIFQWKSFFKFSIRK